LSNKITIDM